ncbi:hypothetical protein EV426DRAFT_719011 [Tirmania nivea]|nr:hypothetical protein EV426DRAFT_719011 [Tirmania nivea]
MPPPTDGLVASEYIHQTSSISIPDSVDAELLTSLNAILATVSLPRITHILDATPNLLIALYEALYQKRIPLVDRTTKSHTSFNSQVKNVKLLIGTIAHEANISTESAARLGEIDPLRVCQKDEGAVRELLWALVRIGILHRIQRNQGLAENVSPRKPLTLHRPVGASGVFVKGTRMISRESGNALSVLHKSLERRKELAGTQSVNPRASHGRLKTYNWLEELPNSFSTLSNINDNSTNDLSTAAQPEKQIPAQPTLLRVPGHTLVSKSMGHASTHSAQPSASAPKSSPHPPPRSKTEVMANLQKTTSRKSSQTLKPNSYPHAVYNVSFDEMPTESAEISPVSTVYLEHVSAKIMEISNRILPVAQMSQFPNHVSEHVVSPKPVSPSQEHSRTMSESSRPARRLKKNSDMSLKKRDKNASFHEQKKDEVVPIVQTLRSNSFLRTLIPIHLENALDHTQDASKNELQLEPASPRSTTHSINKGSEEDETSRNAVNAGVTMSVHPVVEAIPGTGLTEEYQEHDSEMKRGYENDLMHETHDPEDYTSDVDQTPTRPSRRDETAEGDVGSPVWEDETNDLTVDMQLHRNSQLGDPECSVDGFERSELHAHDSAALLEASLATPLTSNEEFFQADPKDEQGHVSISSEHKNSSQAEDVLANTDTGVRMNTSHQRREPLLIDVTQLDIPALPVLPSTEGNLIDLLSDPIPMGLSPICPKRTWSTAPRDLRSESREGTIKSPTMNGSNLLQDVFDLSSLPQTTILQAGEDSTSSAPLLGSEMSSLGSSNESSLVVHQGTQTEAPPTKNESHRIISDRTPPLSDSLNEVSGSDMQNTADKGKHREVDNNSMGRSPLLDDAPVWPTRSDSVLSNYTPLRPSGKRFLLADVFTSTPKRKNSTRKLSLDCLMDHDETFEEDEDDLASNAVGNISLLDLNTELDELSQVLSEYHMTSHDRSPAQSPSPLRRSVRSGKSSPNMQGTPSKPKSTPTRRPDTPTLKLTPTKLNFNSASALDAASSTWETEDDNLGQEEGEGEKDPERRTTQGSKPSEYFPTTEELHKRQMQQMQSIIQNWDQAGSSQPLQDEGEESQYIPDDDSNNAADDEDETSHEQDEEAGYTTTSASQFSNGAGLEDVFADEPETPVLVSRHKQPQKQGDLKLMNLSPPPRLSGFGSSHGVELQTPFTPLRPRRLFSTPVLAKSQRQEKARGESRSLVFERSLELKMQEQEVGNRSLPTTFSPTTRLSPTSVLPKSLTLGRHNRIDILGHDKPHSASLFSRPRSLSAANNDVKSSTPMNQNTNANTSLSSNHPPRTLQMSKLSSRKSSIGISSPIQAGNISLPSIRLPSVMVTSRLKSRGGVATPTRGQGTPSMSVYYTPPPGVGSAVKMGGANLLDMDLSYGLM